eukprot:CAMPEP_0182472334 /NCGR_PEP_ID=MMETSP1319-20130603/21994_1 /TAXON_ID=172717 /ORGANISM="Bolidomonas pacifica, Strain RCC208" /LENGTH=103 /DNA_ID=CAMNT_0024673001 /DNA_START=205 /DNA_END=512 /DNA_ORIENTATION=-
MGKSSSEKRASLRSSARLFYLPLFLSLELLQLYNTSLVGFLCGAVAPAAAAEPHDGGDYENYCAPAGLWRSAKYLATAVATWYVYDGLLDVESRKASRSVKRG